MRGAVFAPGGVRNLNRNGVISAGWRRASRLTGRNALLDAPRPVTPLLPGAEEPMARESLDSSAPPDQPPSSLDSPADLRPGLSASDPEFLCLTLPLTAHSSAATSGCEASPNGLAL
ncbi:MAG TPA: hypothetical protein VF789_17620 [Thermoanaerobaculia bacterium]